MGADAFKVSMLPKIALGVSCLALLFVIIGLALPLYSSEYTQGKISMEISYGVRDMTIKVGGTEAFNSPVNTRTEDCSGDSDAKSDCESAVMMHQSCFAFCFMGMLINIALILALVKASGFVPAIPAPLGEKMPTVGIAGGLCVFYLIGMALGLAGTPKMYSSYDNNPAKDNLAIDGGNILLILALISAIASAVLSFVGIGDAPAADAKAGDVEAPATVPPVVPAAGAADPAESPAADPAAADKEAVSPAAAPVADAAADANKN